MKTNFECLWEEFNIPLKSFIKRRVNNEQDVEDILQNVFLKIYNNINNLLDTKKLHSWVYAIAKNSIIDFYRTERHDLYITCLPEDILGEVEDDQTLNKEISQCLDIMIQFLPEKYKQAIILTEFQNLTQKELANKVGLTVSGAKSRVQRAQLLLKEMLLNCCTLEIDHRGNIIDYKQNSTDCKYC